MKHTVHIQTYSSLLVALSQLLEPKPFAFILFWSHVTNKNLESHFCAIQGLRYTFTQLKLFSLCSWMGIIANAIIFWRDGMFCGWETLLLPHSSENSTRPQDISQHKRISKSKESLKWKMQCSYCFRMMYPSRPVYSISFKDMRSHQKYESFRGFSHFFRMVQLFFWRIMMLAILAMSWIRQR